MSPPVTLGVPGLAVLIFGALPAWAVTSTTTLTVPAPTQGAAGGGSGGFGGGGGGGGGGFGGGGGGGGFGGGGGGGPIVVSSDPRAVLVGFLLIIAFFAAIMIMGWLAKRAQLKAATWSRQHAAWRDDVTKGKRKRRAKAVPPAARSAAEDDPYFAPDAVPPAADRLFRAIQTAWDGGDRDTLHRLVAPEMMIEWDRRLDDFDRKGWANRVAVKDLRVEYVGLVNRADDADDRVVVRVSSKMDDYVLDRHGRIVPHAGNPSPESYLREYWTLGPQNGDWKLLSIEQDTEGEHHLTDPLIPRPEDDTAALRDEAVVEGGVGDRAPAGTRLGELIDVDFADDAMLAARDLSLVDGRADPDVIEVGVRRAISGWAEAVDGEDDVLLEVASPAVARTMLYPQGDHTRLVIRGPKMTRATVVHLDPDDPIRVTVDAKVNGVRYLEDRDTVVVVAGDKDRAVTFTQRFVLALTEDDANPWHLVAAGEVSP